MIVDIGIHTSYLSTPHLYIDAISLDASIITVITGENHHDHKTKQECISVECKPPACGEHRIHKI